MLEIIILYMIEGQSFQLTQNEAPQVWGSRCPCTIEAALLNLNSKFSLGAEREGVVLWNSNAKSKFSIRSSNSRVF